MHEYTITISDATDTMTLPPTEVGFTPLLINNSTTNQTLSNDVYTDKFPVKKGATSSYSHMTKDDYDRLFAFYYRQEAVLYKYPVVTISDTDITGMTARIEVNDAPVVDTCGTRSNVTLTMRESRQNP